MAAVTATCQTRVGASRDVGASGVDVPTRRERVDTPDGDFVDLDWLRRPAGAPAAARPPRSRGLRPLALRRRACSGWRPRRGWRAVLPLLPLVQRRAEPARRGFYHSGRHGRPRPRGPDDRRTGEPGRAAGRGRRLDRRQRPAEVARRAGRRGARDRWRGAVGISVPFDLEACARVMDRGFAKWSCTPRSFMRSLRAKVRPRPADPGFVDVGAALRARTFAAYDRAVTAPLHGFADEMDYWRRASSKPYLARVRRPALLLNALDDPFVPPEPARSRARCRRVVRAEFVPEWRSRRLRRGSAVAPALVGRAPRRRVPRPARSRLLACRFMPNDRLRPARFHRRRRRARHSTTVPCTRCSAGRPTRSSLFRAATARDPALALAHAGAAVCLFLEERFAETKAATEAARAAAAGQTRARALSRRGAVTRGRPGRCWTTRSGSCASTSRRGRATRWSFQRLYYVYFWLGRFPEICSR